MENSANSNTPLLVTPNDKKKSEKKTRRSRRKNKKYSESDRYLPPDENSVGHLTSLKSSTKPRLANGYMSENHLSLPSTSTGIFPVQSSPLNFSLHTSRIIVPSTPKMAMPISRGAIKKNSVIVKERNGPVKEKPLKYMDSIYLKLPAFNNKKRNSKNIWKPPAVHETEEVAFVNSKLSENENLISVIFHFDIESIKNPLNGFFIKKRSSCFKFVNCKSFGSNIPVIFISNFIIQSLDNMFEITNVISKNLTSNKSSNSNGSNDSTLQSNVNETKIDIREGDTKLNNGESFDLCDTSEVLNQNMKKINMYEHEASSSKNKELSSELIFKKAPRERGKAKLKERKVKDPQILEGNSEDKTEKKKVKKARFRVRIQRNKPGDYPDYITEEEVAQGLEDGSLIKGTIRINQRNTRDAYVSNIIKGETDYFIKSLLDQNRALEGDEVILRIKPEADWDEGRKTAAVVYISKMVHSRTSVGKLLPLPRNDNFAAFFPRDKRFPVVHIPSISWPQNFKTDPEKFAKNLLIAKITEWTNPECARGLIIENIGISGNLKVENLAILKGCGLDHEPFSNDVLKYLPKMDKLLPEWLDGREDLRKECIFSIDPLTARDLDDAVSCKTLPDGNLEIGVHIADVSHFLKEGTELDKQVGWKATTIYMVDHVYHMLPVELCMNCSLLPGKDKLSFSVIWTMTPEGEILSTRFAKTVMNSCAQLAYEHAQAIIDNPDNFDVTALPKITNGYTVADIKEVVLKLYHVSKNLRRKRFENGALRIDQIKLSFNLHPQTGVPIGYFTQELKEANRLIEEFMLLANISVAEKIIDSFPEIAFLRLHEPPKDRMMMELKTGLESVGIHVDITSAKSIQTSLQKYTSDDFLGQVRGAVLNHLFAKPMIRARYFCPGLEKAGTSYSHYALNIPLYTHFTSPIRRYADVMVHRLLTASLGLSQKPPWDPVEVAEVAERCNVLKFNAKKAQEESTKLYLGLFINNNGPFVKNAAVVDVKERTFDALVLDSGEIVRIYVNEIEGARSTLEEIPCVDLNKSKKEKEYQKKYWKLQLSYPPLKNQPGADFAIELFSLVLVELKRCPKKQKILAKLLRPIS